jgi:hypothetical protein
MSCLENVHCWFSPSANRGRQVRGCNKRGYYLINENEVEVNLVSSDIDDYEKLTDKIYLGFGKWVKNDECTCANCSTAKEDLRREIVKHSLINKNFEYHHNN